jgi:hypothetical protein
MYGIYLWQNNTYHIVWKNCIYTFKVVNGILGWIFLVYDIDIHELNLRPFRD